MWTWRLISKMPSTKSGKHQPKPSIKETHTETLEKKPTTHHFRCLCMLSLQSHTAHAVFSHVRCLKWCTVCAYCASHCYCSVMMTRCLLNTPSQLRPMSLLLRSFILFLLAFFVYIALNGLSFVSEHGIGLMFDVGATQIAIVYSLATVWIRNTLNDKRQSREEQENESKRERGRREKKRREKKNTAQPLWMKLEYIIAIGSEKKHEFWSHNTKTMELYNWTISCWCLL